MIVSADASMTFPISHCFLIMIPTCYFYKDDDIILSNNNSETSSLFLRTIPTRFSRDDNSSISIKLGKDSDTSLFWRMIQAYYSLLMIPMPEFYQICCMLKKKKKARKRMNVYWSVCLCLFSLPVFFFLFNFKK